MESTGWLFFPLFPGRIGIWKCWFLWREENRSTRRKTLGAGTRTNNKLNPHMTPSLGIEPGPHWWEASALTTAPSLLPHPNLIPIGVIMVHFSTYARPCIRPMTCASQVKEACTRYVIKNFLQRDNTIKKVYLYEVHETLRLNRYEKPLSPFFFQRIL